MYVPLLSSYVGDDILICAFAEFVAVPFKVCQDEFAAPAGSVVELLLMVVDSNILFMMHFCGCAQICVPVIMVWSPIVG